ncbi:hypothetical protein V6R21_06585 [Limibacter armeniacum]|uniref:hypothetical protein n=1 Tax=Limibacter armeniacum TaxID=466084 RepID=UPI002FE5EC2A
MTTIPEVVEDIILRSPFLVEAISEDIINYSALARKIKPEIEEKLYKDVQMGAIVMALKRLKPKLMTQHLEKDILEYIRSMGEIIVRSDLIDYAYKNSTTLVPKQQKLLSLIQEQKDIFHASSKGVYETNIVTSKWMSSELEGIFSGEELLSKIEDLASVTMRTPTSYKKDVPGVFYYILRRLAWENINVVEIISTKHEFSLIVDKSSVNTTFNMLHNLKS